MASSQSNERLQAGIRAYKAGDRAGARQLLREALELDRTNEKAWLWLSGVVDSDAERRRCLQNVLKLDPTNEAAHKGLARLQAAAAPPVAASAVESGSETAVAPLPTSTRPSASHPPATPKNDNLTVVLWLAAIAVIVLVIVFGGYAGITMLLRSASAAVEAPVSTPDPKPAIMVTIQNNVSALNMESNDAYMETIHSLSPNYTNTLIQLQPVFNTYDLKATLDSARLLSVTDDEAQVAFVLTTRKISGPEFRDNRIEGVMILRLEDGRWKIYDQQVDSIDYLD